MPFAHEDVLKIRHSWVVLCYERQNFSALSLFVEVPTSFHLTSNVILYSSTRLLVKSLAQRRVLNRVIFSTKDFAEEFVLRRRKASPLVNPFLTPGGWEEEK